MEPFVQILSNGKDITGGLTDRLLSVEVTDEAESKSDAVSIKLDDRPRETDGAYIDLPVVGTEIEVVMGYVGGPSRSMGTYKIDEFTADSPPATVTISGRAANMPSSFRTPKTESHHQETLGAIIQKVAGRNGLQASVDSELAGVVVRHADQNGESDMAFANRLAGAYDAVAKPVSGRLVLARKGTGKSVSGEAIAPVVIRPSDCSRHRFSHNARDEAGEADTSSGSSKTATKDQKVAGDSRLPEITRFNYGDGQPASNAPGPGPAGKGGVRSYWHDIRTGERKEVTVGEEPFHDLRYVHHNEAEARAAAGAYANKSARGKSSFEAEIGGRPDAQAEATLILEEFRPYIPTQWRIKSCRQTYEPGGGYRTSLTGELHDEKQDDAAAGVKKTTPGKDDTVDKDAPTGNLMPFTQEQAKENASK